MWTSQQQQTNSAHIARQQKRSLIFFVRRLAGLVNLLHGKTANLRHEQAWDWILVEFWMIDSSALHSCHNLQLPFFVSMSARMNTVSMNFAPSHVSLSFGHLMPSFPVHWRKHASWIKQTTRQPKLWFWVCNKKVPSVFSQLPRCAISLLLWWLALKPPKSTFHHMHGDPKQQWPWIFSAHAIRPLLLVFRRLDHTVLSWVLRHAHNTKLASETLATAMHPPVLVLASSTGRSTSVPQFIRFTVDEQKRITVRPMRV